MKGALFLLTFSWNLAHADVLETWECKNRYATWQNILVKATVDEGRATGNIFVAGVSHRARRPIQADTATRSR